MLRLSTNTNLEKFEMAGWTSPGALNVYILTQDIVSVRKGVVQTVNEEDCDITVLPPITIMVLRLDLNNYHLPKGLVQRLGNFGKLDKMHQHFSNANPGFKKFTENQLFPFVKLYPRLEEWKLPTKTVGAGVEFSHMQTANSSFLLYAGGCRILRNRAG